jgi:type 1 glutamine amidotransferase
MRNKPKNVTATQSPATSWRRPAKLLAALGLCSVMALSGLARIARADVPPAKPDDVKKMEAALPDKAPAEPKAKRTVLVFGNAQGFVHSSIGLGEETIVKLGEKTGAYRAVVNNDPAVFDNLKDYDAVVLVSTTGHFLITKGLKDAEKEKSYKDAEKQRMQNLLDFVQKDGKGLVGIHAATDAYYKDSPEYGELIGGFFTGHPWHHVVYKINDPESPLTAMFKGKDFVIDDETYRFKENEKDPKAQPYSPEHVHELTSMDFEKSGVKDSDSRADHNNPVSWIREDGKGRVFYCSHGHSESVYWNPVMLQHYLAGIQFALGDLQADASPAK